MNLREISIGRSKNCDISLDQRCIYASKIHATIFYDGTQLMFRDRSTNGTLINNINVHNRAVPINRGDIIMISGQYQINWNQIDAFFPPSVRPQHQAPLSFQPIGASVDNTPQTIQPSQPDLQKWSWGAFVLSWIWGLFNGCWWMIFINIGMVIFTFVLSLIPFGVLLAMVINFGISIFFGMKGTQLAWENRSWNNVQDFEQTQSIWNKVGIVLFILNIVFLCVILLFFSTVLFAIISQ